MKRHLLILLMVAAYPIALPAHAATWIVDYPQSHLGFAGMQSNAAFEGEFKKFSVTIDFDLDKPQDGKITAAIDMASATAGHAQRDDLLPKPDWFDTKKFPQAQFISTRINPAADDKAGVKCFEAEGVLSIKSIERPVTLPFCLKPEDGYMRAQGKLPLMRNDFHIGTGEWASESLVKYAVEVTVDIAARPAP